MSGGTVSVSHCTQAGAQAASGTLAAVTVPLPLAVPVVVRRAFMFEPEAASATGTVRLGRDLAWHFKLHYLTTVAVARSGNLKLSVAPAVHPPSSSAPTPSPSQTQRLLLIPASTACTGIHETTARTALTSTDLCHHVHTAATRSRCQPQDQRRCCCEMNARAALTIVGAYDPDAHASFP